MALDNEIANQVLTTSIPAVGDHLSTSSASSFIAALKAAIAAELDGTENDAATIEADLEAALGSVGDANDVSIDNVNADTIAFDIEFTHTLAAETIPFDTGLPALGLTTSGELDITITFVVDIRFGVSSSDFFFDTSVADEVQINLDVDLSGLDAKADMGLLKLELTDDPASPTTLGAAGFDIDITGAAGSLGFSTDFDATADINLVLTTDLTEITNHLPELRATLGIDWAFSSQDIDQPAADFGDVPTISFTVELNAESFFTHFVDPLLDPVSRIIEPIRPVARLLVHPIPGFNDLGILRDFVDGLGNGDDTANLLDFVNIVAPNALAGAQGFVDVITALDELIMLRDQVSATGFLPLGTFNFGTVDLRDGTAPASLDFGTDLPFTDGNFIGAISGTNAGASDFFNQSNSGDFDTGGGSDDGSFRFDIIEDPTQAFGLFLDKDATLFTWDLPKLEFSGDVTKTIPIFPLLEIGGGIEFGIKIDLELGYDTFGLRNFIGGGTVEDIFLDGFFIPTIDEIITISAGIFFEGQAGQGLIGEARAGIDTGQDGIQFSLNEPPPIDGKVRLSDLGGLFKDGPFCAFNIEGEIVAFLEGELKVGIDTDFVDLTKTIAKKRFVEAPILPINLSCSGADSSDSSANQAFADSLATLLPDGTLRLNMGPFAGERTDLNNVDGDEQFVVTHVEGDAGNETVRVSAFGFNKTYEGVVAVTGDAGIGNDTISMVGLLSPATIVGGIGDDILDANGGAGPVVFDGGIGMDTITGGPMNDVLRGGENDDIINGGDGDDHIEGGPGNDELDGGGGNDFVFGGWGNDLLIGAAGDDFLSGGAGNDELLGDEGADHLFGGDDSDILAGGLGDDVIQGGADTDQIGWTHDDVNDMHDGSDTIDGGGGTDRLAVLTSSDDETFEAASLIAHVNFQRTSALPFTLDIADVEVFGLNTSEGGDDVTVADLTETGLRFLHLNLGNDDDEDTATVNGQTTADDVAVTAMMEFGESFVDIVGLSPRYQIFDSDADDDQLVVNGGEGNDTIKAAAGVENLIQIILNGGPGDDFLSADAIINGGPGDDFLEGGAGDDTLNGDGGHDTLVGRGGTDTFNGGSGVDTVLVEGTPGNDEIFMDQTAAASLSHRVNADAQTGETINSIERVRVEAGPGDDVVVVRVAHGLNAQSVEVDVRGDAPNASDRLGVVDDGIGNLVLHREAPDGRSGSVTVGNLNPVVYQGIENVDITPRDPVASGTGSDGNGRIVVFASDPFEQNDLRLNPTALRLVSAATVLPSIDVGAETISDPANGSVTLPGDEDWYEFRAAHISSFRFDVLFSQVGTLDNGEPGLPGDGDLAAGVYDADGNLIVAATVKADGSGLEALFSAAADTSYFLRVRGASNDSINVYDPRVVIADVVGPQLFDPDGAGGADAIHITGAPDYDLFHPKPSEDGPTPAVESLTLHFRDILDRFILNRPPGDQYPALDPDVFGAVGNYRLVGDHNGIIDIAEIAVTAPDATAGNLATGTVELVFNEPLPDDRYTLTLFDRLLDPAGNRLDGESDLSEPQADPTFPTGDGVAGGDVVARFTVDSRAEVGVWAAGSVWVDTNGNFVFDSENKDNDDTNEDLIYRLGFTTDNVFAGNFAEGAGDTADGFDKLAAYGRVAGAFRWLIDTDNNGVPNLVVADPFGINGLPVAGGFDGAGDNGDEVGLKNGTTWYLDTNHDFNVDLVLDGNLQGAPAVGDFDADGIDDLGAWADDTFSLDLSSMLTGDAIAGSYDAEINAIADVQFRFGFPGVRERPVAADFNADGMDDIGLWVPDGAGAVPDEGAEWYLLLSGRDLFTRLTIGGGDTPDGLPDAIVDRIIPNPDPLGGHIVDFVPEPFGNDLYIRFGDEFAVPVVGNFDPPIASEQPPVDRFAAFTNRDNPVDVNDDGDETPVDALLIINVLNRGEGGAVETFRIEAQETGPYYDTNGDGSITPQDVLKVINWLNAALANQAGGEGEGAADGETRMANPTLALLATVTAERDAADSPGDALTSKFETSPPLVVAHPTSATGPAAVHIATSLNADKPRDGSSRIGVGRIGFPKRAQIEVPRSFDEPLVREGDSNDEQLEVMLDALASDLAQQWSGDRSPFRLG